MREKEDTTVGTHPSLIKGVLAPSRVDDDKHGSASGIVWCLDLRTFSQYIIRLIGPCIFWSLDFHFKIQKNKIKIKCFLFFSWTKRIGKVFKWFDFYCPFRVTIPSLENRNETMPGYFNLWDYGLYPLKCVTADIAVAHFLQVGPRCWERAWSSLAQAVIFQTVVLFLAYSLN